jgi:LPXTG-site transpeptidase (sortase) family protein
LGKLGSGSVIQLKTPRATYRYQVVSTRVVHETDTWILAHPPNRNAAPRLTLYTCTLPASANRIVVTASLQS